MVQCLKWDSDFFKLRIGRVDITSHEEWNELMQKMATLKTRYDLIYVFSKNDLPINDDSIQLADTKTIYAKIIEASDMLLSPIEQYTKKTPNKDMYHLALVSGVYSRFRLDKRLPTQSYERMYSRWIEQSVNGAMADAVLVHRTDNHIDGLITVQVVNDTAHIGLVAVDECSQGKGIGTGLIKAVEFYLLNATDVRILKVATQWENKQACHLYEKNGFTVDEKTNIYHWWL